jgi:predicted metalloprotease
MRWKSGRQSDNIEDRRGMGIPRGAKIGGVGGLGLLVIVVVGMLFGIDPSDVEEELREFVAVVLADTEDVWHEAFGKMGRTYRPPTLVLFSGAVESACGIAGSAVGPFYCPLDQKVYLDLSFFEDLQARFGAPGDFAQAYVIAHEVGHHVQTLLGISQKVDKLRSRISPSKANQLSVRMELQADCLAGVWAYRANKARQILETGDIEEGLNAASAIGDDRIQRRTQGYVVPDGFTHGSSAQRVRWFRRGLDSGALQACDTFNAERL